MKFTVIEGKDNLLINIYPSFKKEFLDPHNTVKDLLNMFNISYRQYNRLRSIVFKETKLTSKPRKTRDAKIIVDNTYIYPMCDGKGRFVIQKSINNKTLYFGSYDTFETAKKVRDKLIANNWDKEVLKLE